MKRRALLVLGLLPGCFLLTESEEGPRAPPPNCTCEAGVCGSDLLDPACESRRCDCKSGLVCKGDEIEGQPGTCAPPCEPPVCGAGVCGVINEKGPGCVESEDAACEPCDPGQACAIRGGQREGLCVPFVCPPGTVSVDGPACATSPESCYGPPALLEVARDGERGASGALATFASLALTDEADGRWLWFLTNRFGESDQVRLARVRLAPNGRAVAEGAQVEPVDVTPADVGWTYEFAIRPDGSELFLGRAAAGPQGWERASLLHFVRGPGAGFEELGPIEVAGVIGGWTHRPVLLADGRTLLSIVDYASKLPHVLVRETAEVGDPSFVDLGPLSLGPGFRFGEGETSASLTQATVLPGGDGRLVAAERIDWVEVGTPPQEKIEMHSGGLVLLRVPEGDAPFPETAPLALGAEVIPDLGGGSIQVDAFPSAIAFSPEGDLLYHFRHGYFGVAERIPCR